MIILDKKLSYNQNLKYVTNIFQFLAQASTIKQASTYPDLILILRSNKESKLLAVDVLRDHLVSCLIRLVGLG